MGETEFAEGAFGAARAPRGAKRNLRKVGAPPAGRAGRPLPRTSPRTSVPYRIGPRVAAELGVFRRRPTRPSAAPAPAPRTAPSRHTHAERCPRPPHRMHRSAVGREARHRHRSAAAQPPGRALPPTRTPYGPDRTRPPHPTLPPKPSRQPPGRALPPTRAPYGPVSSRPRGPALPPERSRSTRPHPHQPRRGRDEPVRARQEDRTPQPSRPRRPTPAARPAKPLRWSPGSQGWSGATSAQPTRRRSALY